jgi:hypothetical protein
MTFLDMGLVLCCKGYKTWLMFDGRIGHLITDKALFWFICIIYSKLIISWVATNLQDVMQAAGVALVLIGPGSVDQVFVHLP